MISKAQIDNMDLIVINRMGLVMAVRYLALGHPIRSVRLNLSLFLEEHIDYANLTEEGLARLFLRAQHDNESENLTLDDVARRPKGIKNLRLQGDIPHARFLLWNYNTILPRTLTYMAIETELVKLELVYINLDTDGTELAEILTNLETLEVLDLMEIWVTQDKKKAFWRNFATAVAKMKSIRQVDIVSHERPEPWYADSNTLAQIIDLMTAAPARQENATEATGLRESMTDKPKKVQGVQHLYITVQPSTKLNGMIKALEGKKIEDVTVNRNETEGRPWMDGEKREMAAVLDRGFNEGKKNLPMLYITDHFRADRSWSGDLLMAYNEMRLYGIEKILKDESAENMTNLLYRFGWALTPRAQIVATYKVLRARTDFFFQTPAKATLKRAPDRALGGRTKSTRVG